MSFKKETTKGDIPSERTQTSISCIGSKVYLFGGTRHGEAYNDVYSLDITCWTWKKLETKGEVPSPRWGHSQTAFGSKLFIFGGETLGGTKLSDLYILDTETLVWSKPTQSGISVAPRKNHSAVPVQTKDKKKIIIFGGEGVDSTNQILVVLDTENFTWSIPPQKGDIPEPRKGQVCVLHTNKFLVYSGWSNTGPLYDYLDGLWVFDLGSLTWIKQQKKGPFPSPRGGATGTIFGDHFFVFGGMGSAKEAFNEIHYMDLNNFTWLKKKPVGGGPSERYYHAATPIKDKQFLIFGGQLSQKDFSNEVWVLDTSSIY